MLNLRYAEIQIFSPVCGERIIRCLELVCRLTASVQLISDAKLLLKGAFSYAEKWHTLSS